MSRQKSTTSPIVELKMPTNSTSELRSPTTQSVNRLTLRLDEVAATLGVDRRTIERLRASGRFPKPDLQIGKIPLWTPQTISRWIESGGKGRA